MAGDDPGRDHGNPCWTPDDAIPVRRVPSPRSKTKRAREFVKGPLPLAWIEAAARCGHAKALPLLLALKFRSDASGEAWVKPPMAVLERLGIARMDRSRAIAALERTGLIEVQRRRGRPPLVRLLPWREDQGGGTIDG